MSQAFFGAPRNEADANRAQVLDDEDAIAETEVEDLDEAAATLRQQQAVQKWLLELSREMVLTSPDIQRVTRCHHVLYGFGKILRGSCGDWYHCSRPATQIPEFVSHSWKGSAWKKIALLLVLKNGRTAVCLGRIRGLSSNRSCSGCAEVPTGYIHRLI